MSDDDGPKMDPRELEKMLGGSEKVRRLYEAKELMDGCKVKEEEVVHEETGYSWTQDKEEVTVKIPVPAGDMAA